MPKLDLTMEPESRFYDWYGDDIGASLCRFVAKQSWNQAIYSAMDVVMEECCGHCEDTDTCQHARMMEGLRNELVYMKS